MNKTVEFKYKYSGKTRYWSKYVSTNQRDLNIEKKKILHQIPLSI